MENIEESQYVIPCAIQHVAIIMDGNGRWAKARGLSRSDGHRAGTLVAKATIRSCLDYGIPHLTLYAFSQENWKRPATEVGFIFDLLVDFINKELVSLQDAGVRLVVLGEIDRIPFLARRALQKAVAGTVHNQKMILNLALNYSGQEEIVMAVKAYCAAGNDIAKLTPAILSDFLYTKGQPAPDLVIRTSGEIRTSNFLVFQAAYSEYYFTPVLWPDFSAEELRKSFEWYCGRSRRFGDVPESSES